MPDLQQALTAEAIGIALRDIVFFRLVEADTAALALVYSAHLTFEGSIAARAGFGFMTRHTDAKVSG